MTVIKQLNSAFSKAFWSGLVLVYGFLISTHSWADFDIGPPGTGPFAKIGSFVQEIVNLVDGPIALAFSFFSLVGLAIAWAISPRAIGVIGVAVRVLIAVIIILNIGVWITALKSV